jgi:hypothetical protein
MTSFADELVKIAVAADPKLLTRLTAAYRAFKSGAGSAAGRVSERTGYGPFSRRIDSLPEMQQWAARGALYSGLMGGVTGAAKGAMGGPYEWNADTGSYEGPSALARVGRGLKEGLYGAGKYGLIGAAGGAGLHVLARKPPPLAG